MIENAFNEAVRCHKAGQLAEAAALYGQVLAQQPGHVEAATNLGLALSGLGQPDRAVMAFAHAVALRPDSGETHSNLGNALCDAGKWDAAVPVLRRAVELRPDLAAAHANLGNALYHLGSLDESTARYHRALELAPTNVRMLNNLAVVLRERRRLDESIACCRRAAQLQPMDAECYNNLGSALFAKGDLHQAESAYRQALSLRPNDPHILANLGHVFYFKPDWDKAAAIYRDVLTRHPDHPQAHWSLGLVLLTHGNYQEGWPHYEWRWRVKELRQRQRTDAPRWNGEELHGKTILIYNEQGFGDTIQFVRYLPLVAQRGTKIVLACQRELLTLMEKLPHLQRCLPAEETAPGIDVSCPLQSLPGIFATTVQTIPATVPYLNADPDRAARWNQRVAAAAAGRKKIGLVWAGRSYPDPFRSIPPTQLAGLGELAGHWFCSLQKDSDTSHAPPPNLQLTDWTADLHDFADTAALIANLDLIITIDTAAAHLAGAMGKPAWLLLRHVPDWRWMLDRPDSPWYPTLRLFRQETPGDWTRPIQRVVEALRSA